ncbi:MFS transporter [Streptomyces sp. NPDC002523]
MANSLGATQTPGNTTDATAVQRWVAARLDALPVGSWHKRVLAVVGLGSFFNFFEVALSSLLVPLLPAAWAATTTQQSLLVGATFAGELAGALLLSGMADRWGRRRMFQINLVSYALLSCLAACAQDAAWLIALRVLLGVGLGAELALVDTYLTELMPAARRGRMLATAYTIGMLGVPVAGVLAAKLPHDLGGVASWRWLMVVAGLGALCVWLLRRNLPESPRWLAVHAPDLASEAVALIEDRAGRAPSAPQPSVAAVLAAVDLGEPSADVPPPMWGPALRRRTVLVALMQTLGPIGFYGFASIAPLVLMDKGYTVVESLSFSALTALGYPAGCWALMHLAERVQRRSLVIATSLLVAVFGSVFGLATTAWVIVPSGLLLTLTSVVNATVSRAYGAELFPTRIRNTVLGRTYALSRLIAAVLPFCALSILHALGAGPLYLLCAGLIAAMSLAVALLGPRTNNVALEEI